MSKEFVVMVTYIKLAEHWLKNDQLDWIINFKFFLFYLFNLRKKLNNYIDRLNDLNLIITDIILEFWKFYISSIFTETVVLILILLILIEIYNFDAKFNLSKNEENIGNCYAISNTYKETKYLIENKKENSIDESSVLNATLSRKKVQKNLNKKNTKESEKDINNNLIFLCSDGFLEFARKNQQFQKTFLIKIHNIIEKLENILETPPYSILFGRIDIHRNHSKKPEKEPLQKNINNLFYKGFGMNV